jgi:hypothetical protein
VTIGPVEQDNRWAIIPKATVCLVGIREKDVLSPRFKEIICGKTILLGCGEHAVRCVSELEELCFASLLPDNGKWFEESTMGRNGPRKRRVLKAPANRDKNYFAFVT